MLPDEDNPFIPFNEDIEPDGITPEDSAKRTKAKALLEPVRTQVDYLVAQHLEKNGLTAATVKYCWPDEELKDVLVKEGFPPAQEDLPMYLRRLNLLCCAFRLPGTVVRTSEGYRRVKSMRMEKTRGQSL